MGRGTFFAFSFMIFFLFTLSTEVSTQNVQNVTCEDLLEMWLQEDMDQCDILEDTYTVYCDEDEADYYGGEPAAWCQRIQDKYKDLCDPADDRSVSGNILYMLLAVTFCIVVGSWLELINWYYIAGSGITVIVGLLMGTISWFAGHDGRFSEEFFFLVLIPPILFQAGVEIDKEQLLLNFGSIIIYAIIETIFATSIVFGILAPFGFMPSLECAAFGALISAVDPIAILAIFNNFNVEKDLFTMVFGESALNDGVAVVLYQLFYVALTQEVGDRSVDPVKMIYTCLYVFVGSAALGVVFALISAYFMKWCNFEKLKGIREVVVLVLWSLVPYYISEVLGISGIVAILFEGIFIDLYTFHNLSEEAKHHFHFFTSAIAFFCETVIFAYLGVEIILSSGEDWKVDLIFVSLGAVLVSRLSIFPLTFVMNYFRNEKISWAHQVGMWVAGLRGGCAFALAYNIPSYNSVLNTGTQYRGQIVATTIAVIMMEVFVFGSSVIIPFLQWNGLKLTPPGSAPATPAPSHDSHSTSHHNTDDSVEEGSDFTPPAGARAELKDPTTEGGATQFVVSKPGPKYTRYQQWLVYLHQRYFLPFFTHRPANLSAVRPDSLAVAMQNSEQEGLLAGSRSAYEH